MVLIAPSILSADFTNLGKEIMKLNDARADFIHIDVMDGHFVKNFTFGHFIVRQIRGLTKVPFDVHLMVEEPSKMIEWFVNAGADIITIHLEAEEKIKETLIKIREFGLKAGLSIKVETDLKELEPYLNYVDLILVMSIEPGFSGQKFIQSQLERIAELKKMIGNRPIKIEVDGGINKENAKECAKAGADILVAGTVVFENGDYKRNIMELKS